MNQLHDIEGLDPIGWWPLAIAWWCLIAFSLVILASVVYFIIQWIIYNRSWKKDSLVKLNALETNLNADTSREALMKLSEYLRRIALRRFPRKECAGLSGEAWLQWLAEHDPKKYDWKMKGILLIEAPYAPGNVEVSVSQIRELIIAVKHWVR